MGGAGSPAARSPVPWGLWGPAVSVGLFCLVPVVYLVLRATGGDPGSAAEQIFRMRTAQLVGRTAALAFLVAVSAAAVAVPLAWLTVRTRLPGARIWTVLFAAPLAIPSYVGGLVYISAFGAKGVVRERLADAGISLPALPYGFLAAWLVLTALTYPYVFLTVRAALQRLPTSLEDTARTLGLGPCATFFRVVLPQLRPSAAAGMLLVALYTLSDFGAVALLRCDVFTQVIYTQYSSAFDRTGAALNGLVLVALCLAWLGLDRLVRGNSRYDVRRAVTSMQPRRTSLGRWCAPSVGLCCVFVTLTVGVPVVVLTTWLARKGVDGGAVTDTLGLAWTSVRVSGVAAVVTAVAAVPVAVLSVRRGGWAATLVERATYVGFALPGIVLALAFVSFAVPFRALYQTVPLLVLAYAVHFLPQAVGATRGSVLQLDPELEEAGRVLGSTPLRVFWRITRPLVAPGILAGALLVFLTTMKELPATLILSPPGFDTLATEVWAFTEDGIFSEAALPALAILLFSGVPMLAILLLSRKSGKATF